MKVKYDEYYQSENLFGNPYPELINFYRALPTRGKLLDVGCGQGRDAIPLAQLGFEVTGIDWSIVGIQQLNIVAKKESLPLKGLVEDVYNYSTFSEFDYLLLDSMFHFYKKERAQEVKLLHTVLESAKKGALITICIQDSGTKVKTLSAEIAKNNRVETVHRIPLIYVYEDQETSHRSTMEYEMVVLKKV